MGSDAGDAHKASRELPGEGPCAGFGATVAARTPEEINERAKWVLKTGLKWGAPFILWWEMYNNELTKDGKNRGFWLINDKGEKTPLYNTHQAFYTEARVWLRNYVDTHRKLPSQDEFRNAALKFDALR